MNLSQRLIALVALLMFFESQSSVGLADDAAPIIVHGKVDTRADYEDIRVEFLVRSQLQTDAVNSMSTAENDHSIITIPDSDGQFFIVVPSRYVGHQFILSEYSVGRSQFSIPLTGVISKDLESTTLRPANDRELREIGGSSSGGSSDVPESHSQSFVHRSFFYFTDRQTNGTGFLPDIDPSQNHKGMFEGHIELGSGLLCNNVKQWRCESADPAIPTFIDRVAPTGNDDARFIRSLVRPPAHDLLIYVHGFNQSFEEAANALTRLSFEADWGSQSAIVYSWPSQGSIRKYQADSDMVDSTTEIAHFESFLKSLVSLLPGVRLHIVAHSMGNRLLFHAIQTDPTIARSIASTAYIAADTIDTDIDPIAPPLADAGSLQRVYFSQNDLALHISECVNGNLRLGLGAPTYPKGVTTFDASSVAVTDGWGHGYFENTVQVAEDINRLFNNGQPTSLASHLSDIPWLETRSSPGLTLEESLFESATACNAVKLLEL